MTMRYLTVAAALLAGCTASQVTDAIAEGQLVCAVGPTVVAMASTSGAKILAEGATADAVKAVCGLIGGVAVSPPASGTAPTVTVALPASVTVPLKS